MSKDKNPGTDAKPDKESPKPRFQALAVFAAVCNAKEGSGNRVAVVRGQSGQCALLGSTALHNRNLLPDAKCRTAPALSVALGVPCIIGKAKCREWLSSNKIEGIAQTDVVDDPPNSAVASVKATGSRASLDF